MSAGVTPSAADLAALAVATARDRDADRISVRGAALVLADAYEAAEQDNERLREEHAETDRLREGNLVMAADWSQRAVRAEERVTELERALAALLEAQPHKAAALLPTPCTCDACERARAVLGSRPHHNPPVHVPEPTEPPAKPSDSLRSVLRPEAHQEPPA